VACYLSLCSTPLPSYSTYQWPCGMSICKQNVSISNQKSLLDEKSCSSVLNSSLFFRAYRNKTGKMRTPIEALRPCFSVASFLALCSFWVLNSPNNVIEIDPRAVYFMTGTIFSNICVSHPHFTPQFSNNSFFSFAVYGYFLFNVILSFKQNKIQRTSLFQLFTFYYVL